MRGNPLFTAAGVEALQGLYTVVLKEVTVYKKYFYLNGFEHLCKPPTRHKLLRSFLLAMYCAT